MKRIFLALIGTLIIILGVLGFHYYNNYNNETKVNEIEIPEIKIIEEDTYEEIKEEKSTFGLYKKDENSRKLIKEYESAWQYHNDISTFSVFYTNEEEISNQLLHKIFDSYKDSITNIDLYKIGYKIEFKTNEESIDKTILSPKDTEGFYNYLEVYLYDDYHRKDGECYSHTTENNYNEDTILTSIKLTSGKDVDKVTSDILLTAFLYKSDELENGNYNGTNTYKVIVKKAN